jgi:Fe-S cluster assembly protein SufD
LPGTDSSVKQDLSPHLEWLESFHRSSGPVAPVIAELREKGRRALAEKGFPTRRNEDWKYTDVSGLARRVFLPVASGLGRKLTEGEISPFLYESPEWPRLVFVDGRFDRELSSLPGVVPGLVVASLAEGLAGGCGSFERCLGQLARPEFSGFTAQNSAALREGAFIRVAAGAKVEPPLHLLFLATQEGAGSYLRNLIIVEEGAAVTFVETYASLECGDYFTNTVSEIFAGRDAVVDCYRLQMESPSAFHVSHVEARQEEGSRVSFTTVNTGGLLVRNDLNVLLAGERCEATLNGLTLVDGDRHVDNHTAIDHASPNCKSHELYKAVLDGRSRSVFNGKIFVRPGAQKTDAKQTNRSLMLSPLATVNTKPQLEIFADDVKCTHGATVGQLRDEEIFYLRSRGMSEDTARQLLTYGFANDIVEKIRVEPVRAFLDRVQMATLHTSFVSEG